MLRLVLRTFLTTVFLLLYIFLPAGTINWPEAWLFLGMYIFFIIGTMIWLKRKHPDLLRERMNARKKDNVKGWDRHLMRVFSLMGQLMFIICGLDAVRLGWSHMPLYLKAAGFIMLLFPFYLICRVMAVNSYLSEMVRIQDDRGHRVCKDGPYRFVRHPMYVGIIVMFVSVPLALGSFYALVPAFLGIVIIIIRTKLEDLTLLRELEGYPQYAAEVKYRLFPGIW